MGEFELKAVKIRYSCKMERNLDFLIDISGLSSLLFLDLVYYYLFLSLQLLVQQQVLWNGRIRPRPSKFWQHVIITSYVMRVREFITRLKSEALVPTSPLFGQRPLGNLCCIHSKSEAHHLGDMFLQ